MCREDNDKYNNDVQPSISHPLLCHYHCNLLQLCRMAHACAELSARDQLVTSAPARDVRDADNGVDDCGGVERDGED